MTIGKGTASTASASQTLGQFISALAQEVPDTKLLMRIVDRVPAGVAIVRGPEMRFTLVNTAYAAIPATPGRMLGRTVAEVFPTMPAAGSGAAGEGLHDRRDAQPAGASGRDRPGARPDLLGHGFHRPARNGG